MDLTTLIVVWLMCGVLGLALGQRKGRAAEGWFLGAVFGPIGVITVWLMHPRGE